MKSYSLFFEAKRCQKNLVIIQNKETFMSLARIGIRGAYFTSLALAFRQVISLSTTFYVARQLLPSDIGLFSLVMIVIGLAQVIGDMGIGTGVVRSQKNSPILLSTCFWIGAGIGLTLSIVVFVLAPVAGWFYNKAEIEPFLKASAVGLLINFLIPVPMALLQQKLAYKEIAISQGIGSLLGAMIAILCVYSGLGIWGLVLQPIAGNIVILLMLLAFSKWMPVFKFKYSSAQEIIHSGMHLLGAGVASYFRSTFDSMVIGKALPAGDLGIYGMAQTILYAPMHLITSTISRVIFPLLAKVQGDVGKVKDAVLTATSRTALLIFPLYFGLFVLSDEFVLHVFGANWSSMSNLIRIMTISFLVQSIGNVAGPLMLALGKAKIIFRISIAGVLFFFTMLLLVIPYGLTMVAISYATTNAIIGIFSVGIALHYAKIPVASYIKAIAKPFALAAIMGLSIIILKVILGSSDLLHFAIYVIAGISIYTTLVLFFEKHACQQALQAVFK